MKKIEKLIFQTLTFLLTSIYSTAQKKDDYSARIDSLIKVKIPHEFNGVILVSQNGNTKYSKAYGFTNFNKKIPLKLDSNFEIMSNSKQFTSVLLLKEVEKGNIDLKSPIKKYLPNLKQSWADSVTVHQLLNHTHGIINIEKPLAFKAGSDFKYGNSSNILLGEIIEFASKKTYVDLANELFEKQKMKKTFCYLKGNKNIVSGHYLKNKTYKVIDSTMINAANIPADGIITNVKDLAIWNKNLHNGKILKPLTYKLMTSESTKSQHDVFGKDKQGYGYNIRIAEEFGLKYLGHTGLGDGFASLNIYIPKNHLSIIVLENQMVENSALWYYFEKKIKEIVMKSNLVK
jgi:CubicO group peptidase (beta-lactamase class C family)